MTSHANPPGVLSVGSWFVDGGQPYGCVKLEPYQRRDGSQGVLAVLMSPCRDCGAAFLCTAPFDASKLTYLNRRCAEHHRPGVGLGHNPFRKEHAWKRK